MLTVIVAFSLISGFHPVLAGMEAGAVPVLRS
jgi:hypothetical protein